MEDKLSKGGNYKRFKKGSKPEYGNSGPDNFVHTLFKISGSAPVRSGKRRMERMRIRIVTGDMFK